MRDEEEKALRTLAKRMSPNTKYLVLWDYLPASATKDPAMERTFNGMEGVGRSVIIAAKRKRWRNVLAGVMLVTSEGVPAIANQPVGRGKGLQGSRPDPVIEE